MNELPEVVRGELDQGPTSKEAWKTFCKRIALLALQQGREQGLVEAFEAIHTLTLYGPPEFSLAFVQAEDAIRELRVKPDMPCETAEQIDAAQSQEDRHG